MTPIKATTSLIGEAWNSNRPIFYRLPGENAIYNKEDTIPDWLTGFWDEFLVSTKNYIDDIPANQLNPATSSEDWLEFLAPLFGWSGSYWNPQWSVETKRILLSNSYSGQSIWESKGTLATISFVLSAVGIRNIVQNRGDFLVGSSEVGDSIGVDPWAYRIFLPPSYRNKPQYFETVRLNRLFGPCWCDSDIVFDEEKFDIAYILATEISESITTESNESLVTSQEDG